MIKRRTFCPCTRLCKANSAALFLDQDSRARTCLALCRYVAPSSHDIFLADHFKVWFGILNRWLLVRKPHASSVIHDLRSPSVGTCGTAHRPAERVRRSTWNSDRNPTISAMSNPSSKQITLFS